MKEDSLYLSSFAPDEGDPDLSQTFEWKYSSYFAHIPSNTGPEIIISSNSIPDLPTFI